MEYVTNFIKSNEMLEKFQQLVPGGSHTYSKGHDQFPQLSPKIMKKAKGAYCWDVDDNKYIDWAMGNRVLILGHAYDAVDNAVIEQIRKGTNFTKPGILEYEVAEFFTDLIPMAEMVKFGKNGSDVTTAAVKLARAYTGRNKIAVCRQHPFFSISDWFIVTTKMNAGIPVEEMEYAVHFDYNDIDSVRNMFALHQNEIAGVILEPVKNDEIKDDFLKKLREECTKNGAILIFDEMIAGMRFDIRGAHNLYGVYPDLATYGKAIANGYSFSMLAGRRDIMELGGLNHDKPRVFLLSQTHSSETVGLAAALATVKECQRIDISTHIWNTGKKLKNEFNRMSSERGLGHAIKMIGYDCNPQIVFVNENGMHWPELATLFHQEIIKRGLLIPWISITFSHKEEELRHTFEAFSETLDGMKAVLENNQLNDKLIGTPCKPVFRKYNRD